MIVGGIAALILVAVQLSRPPGHWSEITDGMSRQDVYSRLGEPVATFESTKGTVRWRRDLLVGRWEFDVAFRADETVGMSGSRWRWSW